MVAADSEPRQREPAQLPASPRMPSRTALLLQCLALGVTAAVLVALDAALGMHVGPLGSALIQGLLAAALSYWRRLAPWWLAIQAGFPVALVALYAVHLPPIIFLLLFLGSALLYWSTFRTQVPYYPSNAAVWRTIAALLPADRPSRLIDLGSGFGGGVIKLAALRPDGQFSGIELAPLPWLVSRLRAWFHRSPAQFIRGDYMKLNFSSYDVIFAYLSPAAMSALWEKTHSEMRAGGLLLSFEFPVVGMAPDLVMQPEPTGPALYGWHMGKADR